MVERLEAKPSALELSDELKREHGAIMFHQSGGCSDNSAANCYLPTDLSISAYDALLGYIGGVPSYIAKLTDRYSLVYRCFKRQFQSTLGLLVCHQ